MPASADATSTDQSSKDPFADAVAAVSTSAGAGTSRSILDLADSLEAYITSAKVMKSSSVAAERAAAAAEAAHIRAASNSAGGSTSTGSSSRSGGGYIVIVNPPTTPTVAGATTFDLWRP